MEGHTEIDGGGAELPPVREVGMDGPWRTREQAADYLKMSMRKLAGLMSTNAIRYHRLGGTVLFHTDDLDALPVPVNSSARK